MSKCPNITPVGKIDKHKYTNTKYKISVGAREAETSVKASQYNFRWTKLTTCDPERFYKLRPLKDRLQFKG